MQRYVVESSNHPINQHQDSNTLGYVATFSVRAGSQTYLLTTMNKRIALFCALLATLSGCHSNTHVVPSEIWSAGCIELAPYQGSYRLSGMCCEYVLLPQIKLATGRSFAVNGTHHSYTGAGFNSTAIIIRGKIAPDTTLTLSYSLPHRTTPDTYRLRQGPAQVSCQCGCD